MDRSFSGLSYQSLDVDPNEYTGEAAPSFWKSPRAWAKANPRRAVLFACLLALGIVLIVFLGLALALLPLLRISAQQSSLRMGLTNLCSSTNAQYSLGIVVNNPSTVTVELTRTFTVYILWNKTAVAEVDVLRQTLRPGPNQINSASALRVVNTTAAGRLATALINKVPGTTISIKTGLPLRIYGGISFTLPYSTDIALVPPPGTPAPPADPNAPGLAVNVSLADLGVFSSQTWASIRAGAALSPIFLDADIPDLALVVTDAQGNMASNITVPRFSTSSTAKFVVGARADTIQPWLPTVQTGVQNFGGGLVITGDPAASDCMLQQLLQNIKFAIPQQAPATAAATTATTTRAGTRAGDATTPTAPGIPFSLPAGINIGIESASFTADNALTADIMLSGVPLSVPLPTIVLEVGDLATISISGNSVPGGLVDVKIGMTVNETNVARVIDTGVLPDITVNGVINPNHSLLSQALGKFKYKIPSTMTAGAPAAGSALSGLTLNLGTVTTNTIPVTAALQQLRVMNVPLTLNIVPFSILMQDTQNRIFTTLDLGAQNQVLTVSVVVTDLAVTQDILQRAINSQPANAVITGDARNTNSVLSRILGRMSRTYDLSKALTGGAGATPCTNGCTSGLPKITNTLNSATLASFNIDLPPFGGVSISGNVPPISVSLQNQGTALATATLRIAFPSLASLDVTVAVPAAAGFVSDALQNGLPKTGVKIGGLPAAATDNVFQQVLAGVSYSISTDNTANNNNNNANANGPSTVSLSTVSLQGNLGTPAAPNIVVDATLAWAIQNTFLTMDWQQLQVATYLNGKTTPMAVVTIPSLTFRPGAPFPATISIQTTFPGLGDLNDAVNGVVNSVDTSIGVSGPPGNNPTNVIQSVINALTYKYTVKANAPAQPATPGQKKLIGDIQTQLVSSSATQLTLGATVPISSPFKFATQIGALSVSAVYQNNAIVTASLDFQPASGVLAAGDNTATGQLSLTADTGDRRVALENFVADVIAGTAQPLLIQGTLRGAWYRLNPITFSYGFTMPKKTTPNPAPPAPPADGSSSACFEVGLTTPFGFSWSLGKCLPLIGGCKCSGNKALCAVDDDHCGKTGLLGRCVKLDMSIMTHVTLKNPLPLNIVVNDLSLDILFDYTVQSKSSFSNTRNANNILLTSLRPGNNGFLDKLPIRIPPKGTSVISLWLTNKNLAPMNPAAFDPNNLPQDSPLITGILMKEAYDNAMTNPLPLHFRNGQLPLMLENFPLNVRITSDLTYTSPALVPEFILDHNVVCSWKTGVRPPCWRTDGTIQPNCFVGQFNYDCIARGSPTSECSALLRLAAPKLVPNGNLRDMCCRDNTMTQGTNTLGLPIFPQINTFCFNTQQEKTGTFTPKLGSCPANLIEKGFTQQLFTFTF